MANFIQFHHFGTEQGRQTPALKRSQIIFKNKKYSRWNNIGHARKFVKNKGKYVSYNEDLINDNLIFWCEWEPQSEIIKEFSIPATEKELPKYIQIPFWDTAERLQNSDPFIFCNNFIYAFCHQDNNEIMRKLDAGDLILFGSKINNRFKIDTVFVIKEYIDYNMHNYKNKLSNLLQKCPELDEITLKPGSCNPSGNCFDYRLYISVNFGERNENNGMYSFFPAQLFNENTIKGFKRPEIDLSMINPDLINHGLMMGPAVRYISNKKIIKDIWLEIKKQVENDGQNLKLGVFTETPKGYIEPEKNIKNNVLGAVPKGKLHAPYRDKLLKPKTKYPSIKDFAFNKINIIKIEIEFQTNGQVGALIGNQNRDLNPNEYNPVIYIGTDGYLYGKLWDDEIAASRYLRSFKKLTNNKRYIVKYEANFKTNEQKLTLNGVLQKVFSPHIRNCNRYKKGKLIKEYQIYKKYNEQPFFKTDFWQLGTAYTRNKPKTDNFWFTFESEIFSAKIEINGNTHYEYHKQ